MHPVCCLTILPILRIKYFVRNVLLLYVLRGGALTYLLPTPYDFSESDLPVHPCLQLAQVCTNAASFPCSARKLWLYPIIFCVIIA